MSKNIYEKEQKVFNPKEEEREIELAINIIKAKNNLKVVNSNFEYAKGDLIDYYIYQIKAERAKLNYFLKKAKEKGLALDMIDQININYNEVI